MRKLDGTKMAQHANQDSTQNEKSKFEIPNATKTEDIVCPNLLDALQTHLQHVNRELDHWQMIKNQTSYVYSAFTDPRLTNVLVIRIIGIALRTFNGHLFCQLWPKGSKDAYVVQAEMDILRDDHYPR